MNFATHLILTIVIAAFAGCAPLMIEWLCRNIWKERNNLRRPYRLTADRTRDPVGDEDPYARKREEKP